jgi:bifunctional DNA-binding transcriptional regulator/antitoxin component of YhaV-PrlF toxin-antitoxin module
MVKVVLNNGQYKITVPKELALSKGWSEKTILRFVEDLDGNVMLKEVVLKNEKGKK